MWVKAAFGDASAQVWTDLADNILTVTPSWDQAYGLFLSGEADMVLSYTTSPAYHIAAEDDPTKKAALFPEGPSPATGLRRLRGRPAADVGKVIGGQDICPVRFVRVARKFLHLHKPSTRKVSDRTFHVPEKTLKILWCPV